MIYIQVNMILYLVMKRKYRISKIKFSKYAVTVAKKYNNHREGNLKNKRKLVHIPNLDISCTACTSPIPSTPGLTYSI